MHATHELLYNGHSINYKMLLLSRYFYINEFADKLLHLNVIIRYMEENNFFQINVYMPIQIFKEQFVFCIKKNRVVCRNQNGICPPYCHEIHFRTTKKVKCKVFKEVDVDKDQLFILKYKDDLLQKQINSKLLYWIWKTNIKAFINMEKHSNTHNVSNDDKPCLHGTTWASLAIHNDIKCSVMDGPCLWFPIYFLFYLKNILRLKNDLLYLRNKWL